MVSSTQIHLRSRPTGWPTQDNFNTVRLDLPPLARNEVRVANEFVSVDPYMRGRMNDVESYIPPFSLDEAISGTAVGRVTGSTSDAFREGDAVLHFSGWSDVAQGPARGFTKISDLPGLNLSVYLGALGTTGLTAYVGLTRIAGLQKGETVFVSAAAGAVGSVAGQVARLLGARRVIGSAGSAHKVAALTGKYGFDAAFNYRVAPVRDQLPAAAPKGIDVYLDNVGGDHLEAAVDALNSGGRAALCDAISRYNSTGTPAGPDNLGQLITKNLTLEGFTVTRHQDLQPEFAARMVQWLTNGDVVFDETVVEGIDNTVRAFLAMMRGVNTGKMIVRM
ncbi:NADP-dependent oxidoreductase [Arthrobacter sp. Br18]|uniref:NADP-dependent oxidoreductase n=1 Tax=Arthrobacter sp. Br18 TaxID=1312954 RepID=UPI00047CD95D|nr:NADP-dependent oxidoreductase [Arthrobacter sp. Br18]